MTRNANAPRDYCANCKTKVPPARDGMCPYCAGEIAAAPARSLEIQHDAPAETSSPPRPAALTTVYVVLGFLLVMRAISALAQPSQLISVAVSVVALVLLSERSSKGIFLASFGSLGGFVLSFVAAASEMGHRIQQWPLIFFHVVLGLVSLSVLLLLHTKSVREEFPSY